MSKRGLDIEMPCPNHPSGKVRFVIFNATGVTAKTCSRCHMAFHPLAFLKSYEIRGEYCYVMDSLACKRCEHPNPIPIHTDASGAVRMRIVIRDENGIPSEWFDQSSQKWLVFEQLQLRRLKPDGNTIGNQPYKDRSRKRNNRQNATGSAPDHQLSIFGQK